ncbi:Zeaxanthin epoxidase, chloroplastic [Cytospora mali]|uniref:Zeaxanthin epoxidase, chloroplastic n=1 Tax=Cytospora mali TaxID=578113 RepID=A0A194V191_CYTMA|nr:Zeaxanthin epoxidase, chloroplastic [Valsa mali var. pyri (nom. inval.)]
MTSQSSSPVLIIGAGLAGLALAHGLKKAHPPVPFRIFERDSSATWRAQGFRIRVAPEATGLKNLLPDDVWQAVLATSSEVRGEFGLGHRLDPVTCQPAKWEHAKLPPAPASRTVNVDRRLLRNVLMAGLEDDISFGKKFGGYHVTPDGNVEVLFEDGSTASGSVLVGADGQRSKVRRQLLPGLTVLDTEGRAVFGKTFLTPEVEGLVPEQVLQALCVMQEEQNPHVRLLTDVMRFDPALDQAERARYGVPGDYIYWVLVFRKDALGLDEDAANALLSSTSAQASQHALAITGPWHEAIRGALERGDVEDSTMVGFWTCETENLVASWEGVDKRSPVTLIGDAGHPVPPVAAMGLHMAFRDASDLYEALTGMSEDSGVGAKLKAIRAYEASMVERAKATIERSLKGVGVFFGMRPVGELKPASLTQERAGYEISQEDLHVELYNICYARIYPSLIN